MKHLRDFTQHNEGTKIAARAWKGGDTEHYFKGGNAQLQKDALLSLFRDTVGKQMNFKMITGQGQKTPLDYVLIEVTGEDKKNYSVDTFDHLETFDFHFWADEGVKDSAPFADNKNLVVLRYSIKHDEFTQENGRQCPKMNRVLANFLVQAANKLRDLIVTAHPIQKETGLQIADKFHKQYEPDQESINMFKKSKLNSKRFRLIDNDLGSFKIK
jgi:hypothetical protein